jgi:hypothetical protein
MPDLDRLAYTVITTPNRVTKRQAKREMKRRFGYKQAQQAMLRVRQGLTLLAPPQPSKSGNIHQFMAADLGASDATVVTGHKADHIIYMDECTTLTPEMLDAAASFYKAATKSSMFFAPESDQANPFVEEKTFKLP